MEITVHLHTHGAEVPPWAVEALRNIDLLLKGNQRMAKTLDELLAQGDKVMAGVTKNTDLDASIITILNTDTGLLRELRAQLAAAGQDPAKLEALGTLMDQVAAAQEAAAQKKADAITANTDAPVQT